MRLVHSQFLGLAAILCAVCSSETFVSRSTAATNPNGSLRQREVTPQGIFLIFEAPITATTGQPGPKRDLTGLESTVRRIARETSDGTALSLSSSLLARSLSHP